MIWQSRINGTSARAKSTNTTMRTSTMLAHMMTRFRGFVKGALPGLVLALASWPALAQQAVVTQPLATSSINVSGTIGTTQAFQSLFPAGGSGPGGAGLRHGCLVQNTGANPMQIFVYQYTLGSPTAAKSFVLIPPSTGVQGGSFSCANGSGGAIQDRIDITGTQNDTFAATYN